MLNINFFEKKEKNTLPYFILLIFVIGLFVIILTYYFLINQYSNADRQNIALIQERSEEVALSREIERIDQLTNQTTYALHTLEEQSYPIVFLTENIISHIPNEEEQLLTFDSQEASQVYLHLENLQMTQGDSLISDLESTNYIDRVSVNHVNLGNEEESLFQFELTIDINENNLREEAPE